MMDKRFTFSESVGVEGVNRWATDFLASTKMIRKIDSFKS